MAGGIQTPAPFFNHSPAGASTDNRRSLMKRLFPQKQGFYHWEKTRQPDPGAQRYAFTNHRVIEVPIVGDAVANQAQFRSEQSPQVYVHNQAILTNGLGGIINGPIVFQPLSDPSVIDPFS